MKLSDLSKRNHLTVFVQNNYVLSNSLHKKLVLSCSMRMLPRKNLWSRIGGKNGNQGGAGEKAGGGGATDEGGEKQEKTAQQPSLGHYQVRGYTCKNVVLSLHLTVMASSKKELFV
jgi:hypothetical protein